jgi:signal transduction histidine kinase
MLAGMRLVLLLLACALGAHAQEAPLRTLTTAAQLRALSPEEAAQHHPVRLRAVVTLVAPERSVFLRDETGPTFIAARSQAPTLAPGQVIEVEGVSFPGLYVTGVTAERVTVVGTAPLPEAIPATFAQLASGRLNYDWVEVRGVVRSFAVGQDEGAVLTLGMGDGRLEILANTASPEEGARLVDAAVRVRGLAAGFINDRRQLVAPQMRIADLAAVTIEEPPPEDPWALAPVQAAHLLRFEPVSAPGRRVKVRGVVTHHVAGRALFLRDEAIGLFVETAQVEPVEAGAVVEVLGFPEMGRYSAQLRDAVFRVVDAASAPGPVPVTAKALVDGAHDADLVRLEAELLEVLRTTEAVVLLLRAGETALQARIGAEPGASLVDLRPGSRLQLDGVVRVEQSDFQVTGFRTRARSLELLLRRAGDVRVLHAPSWWTAGRLGIAVSALLLLVVVALAWAAMLQRRVRAQTAVIGQKLKTEAALEERQRIAREFHDTLEQELVGLALRLDAAAPKVSDAKPRELLEGARRLVTRIQDEARGFLWNLRDRALEATSLREAIALTVATHDAGPAIDVREEGEPRRLPGRIEHELLRLAQEATANAVRHAAAPHITVTLRYTADAVTLTIADDGRGFDPAREGAKPGHFGLTGMQERVKRLGGTFALRSTQGHGTTIEARVPDPRGAARR